MRIRLRKSLALLSLCGVAFATLSAAMPACAAESVAMTVHETGSMGKHGEPTGAADDCGDHERGDSAPSEHERCLMTGPCTTVAVLGPVAVMATAATIHEAPAAFEPASPAQLARAPETPPPRA